MHETTRFNRTLLRIAAPFAVVAAACSDSPIAPDADAEACAPSTVVHGAALETPPTPSSVRDAIRHAADVMSTGIEDSAQLRALQRELSGLRHHLEATNTGIPCALLVRASTALDAVPDDPASRPDRDGIRLILSLAGGALVAHSGSR